MIERNVDLQSHNTLRLTSTANAYSRVDSLDGLSTAIAFSQQENIPLIPLGEGSNVILQPTVDAHIVDIQLRGIKKIKEDSEHVWVEVAAGENWHQWVMQSIEEQWYGLENLALIPGRVGAAPIQNIGAYGCEVATFIDCVNYIHLDKVIETNLSQSVLTAEQCQFSYRNSIFKQSLAGITVITSVVFKLDKVFSPQLSYPALKQKINMDKAATIEATTVASAVIDIRSEKLPNPDHLPNAGSFFKNVVVNQQQLDALLQDYPDAPYFSYEATQTIQSSEKASAYKIPAAWLIEQCGFKGERHGHLGMHEKQALVLINYSDQAQAKINASDILKFSDHIASTVQHRFGFNLHREPQTLP